MSDKTENYTRNDLAEELSEKLNVSVDTAKDTIEHIITAVSKALQRGNKVEFRGFGALQVVTRNAKIGRNPRDPGAGTFMIPPRKVVRFRTGKDLDQSLNPEEAAAA
jgi:integration host factor subunit beta